MLHFNIKCLRRQYIYIYSSLSKQTWLAKSNKRYARYQKQQNLNVNETESTSSSSTEEENDKKLFNLTISYTDFF